jgi:hypothetical protein
MHHGQAVVFAGPTLRREDAVNIRCDLRPPARRGDLRAVCEAGKQLVVLIDGHMAYLPPPSPTEILDCIRLFGATIVGAASLGALRAVELDNFGMHGMGWVYQEYRARRVDADDELLVLMHPETSLPMTIPMINVRYGLATLRERNEITASQCVQLMDQFRTRCFEERTRELLDELVGSLGLARHVTEFLTNRESDVKGQDTHDCLRWLGLL